MPQTEARIDRVLAALKGGETVSYDVPCDMSRLTYRWDADRWVCERSHAYDGVFVETLTEARMRQIAGGMRDGDIAHLD